MPLGCELRISKRDARLRLVRVRSGDWLVREPGSYAELLEVFRPADPAWRRRVLEVGAGLLERAGRGLAHL